MKTVVYGATSGMAQEVLRTWAARGDELFLVARDADKLASVAADLRARGAAAVRTTAADLNDLSRHAALVDEAGDYDCLLVAHGVLGDAATNVTPAEEARAAELILRTNLSSPVSLLTLAAPRARKGACIAAIGSVAGDRGRASNGVYGASKAGLDAFLSALRQRLHKKGVRVVTLKPGFVDTPMTAHLKKNPLFARPEQVGRGIVKAIDAGRPVAYLPGFWRFIMLAVRAIPEALFRRLSF